MSINLAVPETPITHLKPRISVIGVGGGGGNAVNNMIAKNLEGVDFIVANTDSQALAHSTASRKIQLGLKITQGLGEPVWEAEQVPAQLLLLQKSLKKKAS